MKSISALIIVVVTVLSFAVFAEEQIKTKVKVTVDGRVEASSFITRELRSLGDVEVVSTNQDYSINILVLETKTKQNIATGFALSILITRGNSIALVLGMTTNRIADEQALGLVNAAAVASKDLVILEEHEVETCGPDGLRKVCEEIVARFDSEHLERDRRTWNQIQGILKDKLKKAAPSAPSDPISLGLGPRRMTNSAPTSP